MWISPAFAQAEGAAAGPGALEAFLPIILIFVVFYFLLIRPQQKKMKEHKQSLAAIRRGDKVVTGGGIIGTVSKVVDDNELSVEIAPNVQVRVQRALISGVLSKPQPVSDAKEGGDGDAGKRQPEPAQSTSMLQKLLGGKK